MLVDEKIYKNYKLWPTNYVAYDMLYNTEKYSACYTDKEKRQFQRRVAKRIDDTNAVAFQNFLAMYANPVLNKEKLNVKT